MEIKKKKNPNILPLTDSLSIEMRIWGKTDLSLHQKVLLGYVISMLNSNPKFYASNGHIHSAFGLDKKTVSAAFKFFAGKDWMEVDIQTGGNRVVTINSRQKAKLLEYIGTIEEYNSNMKELKERNIKKSKDRKAKSRAKAKTPSKVQEQSETEIGKIPLLMLEEEDKDQGLAIEEFYKGRGSDSEVEVETSPTSTTAEFNNITEINFNYPFNNGVVDPTKLILRYIPANTFYNKIIEDLNLWWERNGRGIFELDHLITFLVQYLKLTTVNTNLPLGNYIRDIVIGINTDLKEYNTISKTK